MMHPILWVNVRGSELISGCSVHDIDRTTLASRGMTD